VLLTLRILFRLFFDSELAVQALPLLASVAGLIIIFICISGLVGMQLFAVFAHNACSDDVTGDQVDKHMPRPDEWGCGGSRTCPKGATCTQIQNVAYAGVAGFDNMLTAFLTAFQVRYFNLCTW
jgi:hypothetical protein